MKRQVYEVNITKVAILVGLLSVFWILLLLMYKGVSWYSVVQIILFVITIIGSVFLMILKSCKRMRGFESGE